MDVLIRMRSHLLNRHLFLLHHHFQLTMDTMLDVMEPPMEVLMPQLQVELHLTLMCGATEQPYKILIHFQQELIL